MSKRTHLQVHDRTATALLASYQEATGREDRTAILKEALRRGLNAMLAEAGHEEDK